MKKWISFILLVLMLPLCAYAKLSAYWTGVSSIYLTDGKNGIFFDPIFNRPPLWTLALNGEFLIDEKLTREGLSKIQADIVDAIFISHAHFDHYADAPVIAKSKGSKIIGSKTTQYLSLSSGVPKEQTIVAENHSKYQFGDFEIEVLKSNHGLILGLFEYQGGELNSTVPFPITLWNYQMGGAYTFIVRHLGKTLVFQQGSNASPELKNEFKKIKADIIFQGVANRKSTKVIDDDIFKPLDIKTVIPIHQDNFFFQISDPQKIDFLPLINYPEFLEYMKKTDYQLIEPMYYKEITL